MGNVFRSGEEVLSDCKQYNEKRLMPHLT